MLTVLCVNGANVKQNYKVQEVNSILSYTRQTLDYYVVTWVLLVWKILCKMHNLNDNNEYTLLTLKIVCYLHKCYWSHLLSLVTRACRFKICFIQTFHSFTVILYFICILPTGMVFDQEYSCNHVILILQITIFLNIYLFLFFPQDFVDPIMCSYKAVKVKFEVWGLQTKVEEFTHRVSNHCYNFLTY